MGNLFADVRYAVRLLIRKPGFAAVAILTLALGVGATTAIFTVVHAVLLRPLPFPEADRLVEVRIVGRNDAVFPLPDTTTEPLTRPVLFKVTLPATNEMVNEFASAYVTV